MTAPQTEVARFRTLGSSGRPMNRGSSLLYGDVPAEVRTRRQMALDSSAAAAPSPEGTAAPRLPRDLGSRPARRDVRRRPPGANASPTRNRQPRCARL